MDSRKEEENPVSAAQPPNSDCELTLRRRARAAEGPDVGAWSRAASGGGGPSFGPRPAPPVAKGAAPSLRCRAVVCTSRAEVIQVSPRTYWQRGAWASGRFWSSARHHPYLCHPGLNRDALPFPFLVCTLPSIFPSPLPPT